ncbi:hypothetical protein QJQ45_002674 [Haematococcus lacustris]|nr:hypothetical protein QJQ45_002674 [Haematococcus lacustris]
MCLLRVPVSVSSMCPVVLSMFIVSPGAKGIVRIRQPHSQLLQALCRKAAMQQLPCHHPLQQGGTTMGVQVSALVRVGDPCENIGKSKWRPLQLCWWLGLPELPAEGKEYPELGCKRL